MTTLALVDFSTLEKRSPLPEGVQVSSLSWSPDGRQLAFTAEPLPGILSSAAQETYAKAGIYLLDPQSDAVRNLLSFPDSAAGGWVRWTTDGKSLIYALALLDPTGKTSIEVHAYEPAGSLACVLIQGLPLSGGARERMDWHQIIAYGPNPNE
jgi:Tol biopolymer transport system component